MPAATPRKKHIFCHIAMSVKFRSRVFVYVCVCVLGYVYARVSASRVLSSSNSISFADKHFCRQADRQGGMRERMSVCMSVCLFVRVCVCVCACWLLRAGIRMHWLSFCFYFCLFFPPSIEDRGIEVDIHIGFFSYLKLLWRGFTRLEHNAHPHAQTHAAHERRLKQIVSLLKRQLQHNVYGGACQHRQASWRQQPHCSATQCFPTRPHTYSTILFLQEENMFCIQLHWVCLACIAYGFWNKSM